MNARNATKCGWCGKPAEGFAFINSVRFCHDGPSPTCYERANQLLSPALRVRNETK